MKKTVLFTTLILISSLLIISCHCKKKTADTAATTEVKRDFEKEGFVKANVIFSDLASCPYLLVLANEKRLEPAIALAAPFQQDQLAVWVKYAEKKGAVSVCMSGQIVDISDIQIRK